MPNSDAVTLEEFKTSRWLTYYMADISNLVRNGKTNPNHLFEMFGKFNGKTAVEVRMLLLRHIESNMEFYERRSVVCLKEKSMRFDSWIESIGNEQTYCDELALIGLCALYNRHCLIFTKNKFWSTLDTTAPIGFMQLLQQCSVKLVFLGDLKFGLLNWNPRPPKPSKPRATAVPRFSIVEEYTLDDSPPETTPIDLTKNVEASPVETPAKTMQIGDGENSATSAMEHSLDTFNQKELYALPVGTFPNMPADLDAVMPPSTSDVPTSSPVKSPAVCAKEPVPVSSDPLFTCPEDGLVLSHYPWKKNAVLKVEHLTDLTIDLWCNQISDYYQYAPVSQPVLSTNVVKVEPSLKEENKSSREGSPATNYDAETDVDIENLLQHAESLVRKVKDELNPEKEKPIQSDPSLTKRKHKELPVEANSHQKCMWKRQPGLLVLARKNRCLHCMWEQVPWMLCINKH